MAACDLKLYKLLLVLVNLLFALSGLALIVIGSVSLTGDLSAFDSQNLAWGLIILGVFIFLVAIVGCCGASKDSHGFLKAYFALVFLIMVAQVAVGITAYVNRDSMPDFLHEAWNEMENDTKGDVEKAFNCTGWYNSTDSPAVPPTENVRQTGCQGIIEQAAKDNAELLFWTAIGFACVEVLVLVFSCCLIQRLPTASEKEQALLEEARRLNREGVEASYQQSYPSQNAARKV